MVSRKLHYERSRIACEHLCFLKNDTGNDYRSDTDEVCAGGYPRRTAEYCACDHCDERNLSAAGDKCGGHYRHTAVTLVLDGT